MPRSGVEYFVDGVNVATHAIGVSTSMRQLMSDFTGNGPDLSVHWVRMSPTLPPLERVTVAYTP